MSEETHSLYSQQTLSDIPMMSEKEGQVIIKQYNQTIEEFTKENNVLRQKVQILQTQLNEADAKYNSLEEKQNEQNNQAIHLVQQEEELNTRIDKILASKHFKNHQDFIKKEILTFYVDEQQLLEADQLIQFEENQGQQPDELTEDVIAPALGLLQQLVNLKRKRAKPVECIQCHQFYNPQCNYKDSCYHHPGKMKFYSCRKCGADDYYTCCLKCQKCSEGCKYNFHTPKGQ